jgi:hypothetical protein
MQLAREDIRGMHVNRSVETLNVKKAIGSVAKGQRETSPTFQRWVFGHSSF